MTYQEYLQMMIRGGMNPSQLPTATQSPVQGVQTQYNRSIAPGPRVSGAEPMGYGGYTPLPSNVTNQALQAPPQQQPPLGGYQANVQAMAGMAPQGSPMPQYKPAGQGLMQMADGRVMVMGGAGGTRILSGAEAERAASYAGQVSGVQPGTGIAYDAKGKAVGGIGPGGDRFGDLSGPSMVGSQQMKFDAASGRYVPTDEQGPGQSWLPTPGWTQQDPTTGKQFTPQDWRASEGQGPRTAVKDYQNRVAQMKQMEAAKEIAGGKADAEAAKGVADFQQKLSMEVAKASVRQDFEAARADADFYKRVEQPQTQYLEEKWGEEWNGAVRANPAVAPMLKVSFIAALRRAEVDKIELTTAVDAWAKGWFDKPFLGESKASKAARK